MDVKRRLVVPLALAWLLVCVPLAQAGPLDACAQRVIRDWYSGGRVDELYPLGCYRAAIRALPNDVLEYSDADEDIARALAFARQARADDDAQRVTEPTGTSARTATEPVASVAERPTDASAPPRVPRASPPTASTPAPPATAGPRRAAAGPEPAEVSAALPYPVIVLAALAATLLAIGAAGWLLGRRR